MNVVDLSGWLECFAHHEVIQYGPGINSQIYLLGLAVFIRAEEAYRDKLGQLMQGLMDDLLTGRMRVKADG